LGRLLESHSHFIQHSAAMQLGGLNCIRFLSSVSCVGGTG